MLGTKCKALYVLGWKATGGYLYFSSCLAEMIMERGICIHSQSLSAYCIKIWQSEQLIITQVT